MARWMLMPLFITVMLGANPVFAAEFLGGGATARLPVKVRILDFQTTQRLCGSETPPHWCPAHLLKRAELAQPAPQPDDLAPDLAATPETRARLAAIKSRIVE